MKGSGCDSGRYRHGFESLMVRWIVSCRNEMLPESLNVALSLIRHSLCRPLRQHTAVVAAIQSVRSRPVHHGRRHCLNGSYYEIVQTHSQAYRQTHKPKLAATIATINTINTIKQGKRNHSLFSHFVRIFFNGTSTAGILCSDVSTVLVRKLHNSDGIVTAMLGLSLVIPMDRTSDQRDNVIRGN